MESLLGREHEPKTMTPFLNAMIGRIVFGEQSRPRAPPLPPAARLPRPPSFYFAPEDIPGGLEVPDADTEAEEASGVVAEDAL